MNRTIIAVAAFTDTTHADPLMAGMPPVSGLTLTR